MEAADPLAELLIDGIEALPATEKDGASELTIDPGGSLATLFQDHHGTHGRVGVAGILPVARGHALEDEIVLGKRGGDALGGRLDTDAERHVF